MYFCKVYSAYASSMLCKFIQLQYFVLPGSPLVEEPLSLTGAIDPHYFRFSSQCSILFLHDSRWQRLNVAETQCLENTSCSGARIICGQLTQRTEPSFTSGGSLMTALHSIRCRFSLKKFVKQKARRAQLQCYWKGAGTEQDQRTGRLRLRGWSSGP